MRSLRLTLVLGLLLALAVPAAGRAQAPDPSPEVVCRAIAERLRGSSGILNASGLLSALGIGLDPMCGAFGPITTANGEPPTLEQLVGQKLMVRMGGTKPSAQLLRRVRRGEVGGVVLIGSNIRNRAQVRRLTRRLQRAAREGGQPPLLIAIDQEGGDVRRVPWAPPTMTVPAMGRNGRTAVAYRQGRATGRALRALGINMDLAPVADIPRRRSSFMNRQGRVFSFDADVTTRLADAFARGLGAGGVLATMKHFPGIGLATRNTDRSAGIIRASTQTLQKDLRPYRRAIRNDLPVIMLSNATYPAYDAGAAAGWSRTIVDDLLRDDLGFEGMSLTDSLDGTAAARGVSAGDLAERAARAGTDMILLTGSERTTARVYRRLLLEARAGRLDHADLVASWQRIQDAKGRLDSTR
ncbi:MAG: glycoside hydrolase family 3 N-terminal domain-containing protein [Candidatus Limnocylindrales bacterium]